MNRTLSLEIVIIWVFFVIFSVFVGGCSQQEKDPVDYVNPNIGTIPHLLVATSPDVHLPHGMVRLAPNTDPKIPERYLSDKIFNFPIRQSTDLRQKAKPSWIMATTDALIKVDVAEIASEYDHNSETVTPYYYAVLLDDYDIKVENTVTEHAAYYRFTFSEAANSHILMGSNAKIESVSDHIIQGSEYCGGFGTYLDYVGVRAYFYAEFSKPFASSGNWKSEEIFRGRKMPSEGVYTSYATSKDEQVEVKIGISYISIDQARQNLEKEIPSWGFEQVKNRARRIWNEVLGKIKVEGGTEKERTVFYTAFYRSMAIMPNLTEYGRYYSSFDNQVHSTDGHDFYRVGTNWGCRDLYPLLLILEPERQNDILRSYVRMEEQDEWLSRHRNHMISRHECVTITDAYMKGFRDFDLEKAYEGMKKYALETTMLSRPIGNNAATELDKVYYEKGYFPALPPGKKEWVRQVGRIGRQSVSITLENCYDDWCIAQLAKALGKSEDYDYFMKRAHNYQNVFDSRTGFMRPKTADGEWVEPFDPIWSGGQAGRDYFTENNCWNYTWYVPHDVQGLINLMGGKEKFVNKLDELFQTFIQLYNKGKFLGQFPDMTALMGMYSHGNENTRYIPYLYNYAGAPWLTQKRVRDIMMLWYDDDPLGICGDEDGGLMSAWYVLSAMGFYQLCPGRPYYDIGSPIFEKVTIDVGNGKTFVIKADKVTAKNKYIQSARLNGAILNKPWFEHSDLVNGGTLVLNMGPRPNKEWGSAPEAVPPSMTR